MTEGRARPIEEGSWLNSPRFTRLRATLIYASTKTTAIPALSKISPEEAAYLFMVMQRGWGQSEGEAPSTVRG